jgi:hypothetical protein
MPSERTARADFLVAAEHIRTLMPITDEIDELIPCERNWCQFGFSARHARTRITSPVPLRHARTRIARPVPLRQLYSLGGLISSKKESFLTSDIGYSYT